MRVCRTLDIQSYGLMLRSLQRSHERFAQVSGTARDQDSHALNALHVAVRLVVAIGSLRIRSLTDGLRDASGAFANACAAA